LDRISRTSLIVAMLLPHILFIGVCVTIKLLFSSTVTWLARDTYAIFILSTLYPWIWTLALIFQYRHPTDVSDDDVSDDDVSDASRTGPPTKQSQRVPLKDRSATSTKKQSFNLTKAKAEASSKSIYPRTTPKTPTTTTRSSSSKKQQQAPKTPVQRLLAASRTNSNMYSMEMEATYWMQYWIVYCLFTGCGTLLSLVPIFGRIASRSIWLQHFAFEFQLLFYLWIYGLGSVLTSTASSDADMERTYLVRPLPFLMNRISPLLQTLYKAISEQIIVTPSMWNVICEKAKSFLNIAVMMRLLSESTQDRLLASLAQAHPFVVPAISLLLPSFLTKYGVLYVKTIVPSAKASLLSNSTKRNKNAVLSLENHMVTLQYWVVHVIVSGTLSWWSGLLWWIPFSTHLIFLLWCHLQVVTASGAAAATKKQQGDNCYYYYSILEQELQAFGLLPKGTAEQVMAVDKTVTATMLRRLAKSLPSASDDDNENVVGVVGGVEEHNVVAEENVTVPPRAAVKDVASSVSEPNKAATKKVANTKKASESDEDYDRLSDASTESSTLRRSSRARKVRSN
jgi:hypothetical protein